MSKSAAEIYKTRRENFLKGLTPKGLKKAIVGRPTTLYYLTGVMLEPYERFIALILDAEKNKWLAVLPSLEQGAMARGGADLEEIIYQDSEDPAVALKKVLGHNQTLGMEMNYFTVAVGQKVAGCADTLVDVGDIVLSLRARKDALEIENMRAAALCADKALTDAAHLLRPGVSEKDFALELLRLMVKDPDVVTDRYIIQILGGANSAGPHGATSSYVFKKGDAVTVDFGAYYKYYWSDFCRTFFVEEAPARLKEAYPVVLEAHLAGMAKAGPGVPAKEVDMAARSVIEKAGMGELFIHRTGHGLGLDIHEDPYIHSENDLILEEGMIFSVEPGIYIPGLGGIRIEDDVLVTKEGRSSLNTFTKDYSAMIIKA